MSVGGGGGGGAVDLATSVGAGGMLDPGGLATILLYSSIAATDTEVTVNTLYIHTDTEPSPDARTDHGNCLLPSDTTMFP